MDSLIDEKPIITNAMPTLREKINASPQYFKKELYDHR
jgi:hypothetical protein